MDETTGFVNKGGVYPKEGNIVIVNSAAYISREDALNLAAWLSTTAVNKTGQSSDDFVYWVHRWNRIAMEALRAYDIRVKSESESGVGHDWRGAKP